MCMISKSLKLIMLPLKRLLITLKLEKQYLTGTLKGQYNNKLHALYKMLGHCVEFIVMEKM